VDWEYFKEVLEMALAPALPLPLASADEFQHMAQHVTHAIKSTIETCVLHSKPCPHSKRWWTHTLSNQCKQVSKLSCKSSQMRGLPDLPCHVEYKTLKNQYANEIAATKKQHWIDWLEDLEGNDLWTANHYVSSEPTDGGKSCIPTLTARQLDGSIVEATTNDEKSTLIANTFFPPPPTTDSIPADFIYPDPVAPHTPITSDQIARAISKLSSYKAPGPDSIRNIVFKQCTTLLTPYLVSLFNAVFTYQMYYDLWKSFTMVVL
jgi:hypothetical protein